MAAPSSKVIRMWLRQDGGEPKAVARSAVLGPGAGRLVDVTAASSAEARAILARVGAEEPDQDADGDGWLAWSRAQRAVREVTS